MAETKLSKNQTGEGIWTKDTLVAGDNLSIELLAQPLIDEYTDHLFHFNNNFIDEISGEDCSKSDLSAKYINAKFDTGFQPTTYTSSDKFSIPTKYYWDSQDHTIDFWVKNTGTAASYAEIHLCYNGTDYGNLQFYQKYLILSAFLGGSGRWGESVVIDYPSGTDIFNTMNHFAFCYKVDTHDALVFLNGKLLKTIKMETFSGIYTTVMYIGSNTLIDELRYSSIVRWTSDFDPFEQPYTIGGSNIYKIQPNGLVNMTELNSALDTKQNILTAWNKTNLIAGDNIAIATVPSATIDSETIFLAHFDTYATYLKNSITGDSFKFSYSSFHDENGKFGTGYADFPRGSSGSSANLLSFGRTFQADDSFTVDYWFKPQYLSSYTAQCYFAQTVTNEASDVHSNGFCFMRDNNVDYAYICKDRTASKTDYLVRSNILSGWNHIAYEKIGSTHELHMYLNGKKLWTQTNTLAYSGCLSNTNNYQSLIDELRVSSVARYNGKDFTPFNEPYSNDNPAIYKINANIETNIIRTSDVEQSNILPMIPGNLDSIRKAGIYSIILSVDQQGFTVELPYRLDVVSYSYMGASMACMQYLNTKILNSNITLQRSDEGDGQGFGSWKVSELPPSSEYYSGITGTTLNISSICDYEDLIHPSMISVYKNGAKLYPDGLDVTSSDIQYDYSITGKTITFHTPLIPSDLIEVRYS